MTVTTNRLLAAAAALGIALAVAACSGGTSIYGTASPTASPTATGTSAAAATATPTETPAPTATVQPAAPVITADNAKDLAPGASAKISGFSPSAWSADGSEFIAVTQQGLVEIDAATGQAGAPIDLSSEGRLLGIAPDGHTLAFATKSGVRLWDLATGQDIGTLDSGSDATTTIGQAIFTDGGKTVALVHVDHIGVTLWDVASAKEIGKLSGFQTAAPVYTIHMSVDGSEAAWVARGTVQFANVQQNTLGARLSFQQFVANARFLPDGHFLTVVPGSGTNGGIAMTVTTWDPTSGKQLAAFTIPMSATDVAISPDGKLAAAATSSAVSIWDIASGKEVASLSTAGIPARLESFSPTGITLASMLDDGTLQFLRVSPASNKNRT